MAARAMSGNITSPVSESPIGTRSCRLLQLSYSYHRLLLQLLVHFVEKSKATVGFSREHAHTSSHG